MHIMAMLIKYHLSGLKRQNLNNKSVPQVCTGTFLVIRGPEPLCSSNNRGYNVDSFFH